MVSTRSGEVQRIAFCEGKYVVKSLEYDDELREARRLRHKVYAETVKWVPSSPDELEVDLYDTWSTSIGLFSHTGKLSGVIRLLPSSGPFMLESDFRACLLPGYEIRKEPDTNEITRLTIDPTSMEKGLSSRMLLVLLKGLYQWLLVNDIRYSYMVVEKRFLRVLNVLGFPARAISPCQALPPAGALSVAALLDWEEFQYENAKKRPAFLEWMSTVTGREDADDETSAFGDNGRVEPLRHLDSGRHELIGDKQYVGA